MKETAHSKLPLPPGNFGLPFIGETLKFFTDADFASKRHAEFGPVFKTKLLGSPNRQTLLQSNPDRPEKDALDIMRKATDEDTG